MRNPIRNALTFIMCVSLVLTSYGCPARKKKAETPSEEGVVKKAYAIHVLESDREALVNATPEQISAFLIDPGNWREGILELPVKMDEPLLGASFPFNMTAGGRRAEGRMVVIKYSPDALWYLWTNPKALHTQRWSFKAEGEKTRVTLNVLTEVDENDATGGRALALAMNDKVGRVLASLEAEFDPSLDVDKLVKEDRVEPYDGIIQAYESVAWINAPPKKVMEYGLDPKNVEALGGMHYDKERVMRHGVGYAPLSTSLLGMDIKLDTFFIDRSREENMFVTYFIVRDWVGFTKTVAEPEAGGSRTHQLIAVEIPGTSPSVIELLYAMTGIPNRLEQSMVKLKAGVEG